MVLVCLITPNQASQLLWFFYTHSHNFRLLFMALTLPCDWSGHTLSWPNWHAWPCSSRKRYYFIAPAYIQKAHLPFFAHLWNSSVYSSYRGRKIRWTLQAMSEIGCLPRLHRSLTEMSSTDTVPTKTPYSFPFSPPMCIKRTSLPTGAQGWWKEWQCSNVFSILQRSTRC